MEDEMAKTIMLDADELDSLVFHIINFWDPETTKDEELYREIHRDLKELIIARSGNLT